MSKYNLRNRRGVTDQTVLTADEETEYKVMETFTGSDADGSCTTDHMQQGLLSKPEDEIQESVYSDDDTYQSTILLVCIFIGALVAMGIIYHNFPPVKREDAAMLKLPKSMADAQGLGRVISDYKDDYFKEVLLAFMVTYIFLQSFAIPGSIFLSILSGFLFPFPLALLLVCLCSAVGASLCYLLSSLVGKRLVKKYFPERVANWKMEIAKHDKDILNYIIFLRITPFLPNWFINITSPVLNVSLSPFFWGTFIGVAPPSVGFISAGVELYELTTYGDAFSFKSIVLVIVSAVLSLVPVLVRKLMVRTNKED